MTDGDQTRDGRRTARTTSVLLLLLGLAFAAGACAGPPEETSGGPAPAPPQPVGVDPDEGTHTGQQEGLEAAAARQLDEGTILYNPPDVMNLDDVTRVEVRVARQSADLSTEGLEGAGEVRTATLPVDTKMRVALTGTPPDAFAIQALGSDIQVLREEGFTEWEWDVVARAAGRHRLNLVVEVVYDDTTLDRAVFGEEIEVNVSPGRSVAGWFADNWDRVLAALGVTGVGALGAARARIRRRSGEDGGGG